MEAGLEHGWKNLSGNYSTWIQSRPYRLLLPEIMKISSWQHHVLFWKDSTGQVFIGDSSSDMKLLSPNSCWRQPGPAPCGMEASSKSCTLHTRPTFCPAPLCHFDALVWPSVQSCSHHFGAHRTEHPRTGCTVVWHHSWSQKALVSGCGSKKMEILVKFINGKSGLKFSKHNK